MPAVGFSLDLDSLAELSRQPAAHPVEVLVYGAPGHEIDAQQALDRLCDQGLLCEMSLFETEEETLAYAREMGIPKVRLVGETTREIGPEAACEVTRNEKEARL